MSPRPSDAPQRVVDAAADMLARVGLNATSIREVTKAADAPLGSTYHHFPGGKQELLARATAQAGDTVDALLEQLLRAGAEEGLRQFLAIWRERLLRSQLRAGCPVLASAVEEPSEGGPGIVRDAAAAAFARWEQRLADALQRDGHAPAQACERATLLIAGVEGAVALSRAMQDIAPFDRVSAQLLRVAVAPASAPL